MTPLLAILDSGDYGAIAVIVLIFASFASLATRQRHDLRLERKLDALLKHEGVELPSRLSPEVQLLARDPRPEDRGHQTSSEIKSGFEPC